jgi:hypothetical protein
LHNNILNNTTKAISNCVDDVLRALCSNDSVDGAEIPSATTLHRNDSLVPYVASQAFNKDEGTVSIVKDSLSSTREMIQDLIYYYMDKSFPPLPVVQFQDVTLKEIMSTSDVF